MSLTSVDMDPYQDTPVVNPINPMACPECGQVCKDATGLGVHRSVKHGVTGKKPNKARRKRKVAAAATRVLAKQRRPRPVEADEIIQMTAELLWPNGTPTRALPHLVRWYAQTAEFLELASPEILDP